MIRAPIMLGACAAALLLLSACCTPQGQAAAPTTPAEPAADACGAARYSSLIGTDAAAIDRASLPARTRVITPDMMVTQDYSAERLNIMVGTDGKVGSVRCY